MKSVTIRVHPLVLVAIAVIGLPSIAIAAGTILNPPVTVTGTMAGALLTATNHGSGGNAVALLGKSPSGKGVVGETSFDSTSTKDRESGVVGIDSSTSGSFNAGVRGNSGVGTGVQGVSGSANGVDGQTTSAGGASGVLGEDLNASATANAGVTGKSILGVGVQGISKSGTAVIATSTGQGTALVVSTKGIGATIAGGGMGIDIATDANQNDIGIRIAAGLPIFATDLQSCSNHGECGSVAVTANDITSQGTAVLASSTNSTALDARSTGSNNPTVVIEADATPGPNGTPIAIAVGSSFQGSIMELDTAGNMTISGTLTQNGQPKETVRSHSGETDVAYGPRTTLPILEDFGEAQLVHGRAHVDLDPRFAAVIDRGRTYLVFMTPLGDSNGLFVQSKTVEGFDVIEARGGHSSVGFDYRIVAKPFDSGGQRMPIYVKPPMRGRAAELLAKRVLANHKLHFLVP